MIEYIESYPVAKELPLTEEDIEELYDEETHRLVVFVEVDGLFVKELEVVNEKEWRGETGASEELYEEFATDVLGEDYFSEYTQICAAGAAGIDVLDGYKENPNGVFVEGTFELYL